jgi:hypothetical protein
MSDNVSPAAALVQRLTAERDAALEESARRGAVIEWQSRQIDRWMPCPDCRDKVKAGDCQRCRAQRAEDQRDAALRGGGSSPTGETRDDSTGLSIDMLDVDRLRSWADLIDIHGADITHWGQVAFVVAKLREIADGVEQAVRDIGALRKAALSLRPRKPHITKTVVGSGRTGGPAILRVWCIRRTKPPPRIERGVSRPIQRLRPRRPRHRPVNAVNPSMASAARARSRTGRRHTRNAQRAASNRRRRPPQPREHPYQRPSAATWPSLWGCPTSNPTKSRIGYSDISLRSS